MAEDARHSNTSSRAHLQIPSYTPSISPEFNLQRRPGRFRSAPDTQIGAHRPAVRQGFHRKSQTQIPLSALCPMRADPGKMGGDFCSATKFKCIPLPTMYSRHAITPHALKTVSLHTQRYTPAPSHPRHTHTTPPTPSLVSYSMLSMPVKTPSSSRQHHHQAEREIAINKARSLQRAREVVPHRLHWAFYMTGQPAEVSERDRVTNEDLMLLQQLTLSQNPSLYYGTGIRSGSGRPLKEVTRFERRVVEALNRRTGGGASGFGRRGGGTAEWDGGSSRLLSGTVTPGSPIMELDEVSTELDVQPPPLSKTFLTDPPHSKHMPPL